MYTTINLRITRYVLMFVLLTTISCTATQTATQTDEKTGGQSLDDMAKAVVEALNANDLTPLDAYLPDVDIAREIAPKETTGLSDTEIEEVLIGDLRTKLLENFENVRKGLEKPNDQIRLTGMDVEPSENAFPSVLSLKIEAPGKTGSIPVTFDEMNGKFYLFEILLSVNALK